MKKFGGKRKLWSREVLDHRGKPHMRGIDNRAMRHAVEEVRNNPTRSKQIMEVNGTASKKPRTIEGYIRDWELLREWTGAQHITDLTEEEFFAPLECLVGRKSASRVENFRSCVVERQVLDMPPGAHRWTQDRGFQTRFQGFLKRVEAAFRDAQDKGLIPKTKRGAVTINKLEELVDFCIAKGEADYAVGFYVGYQALLRHNEISVLTRKHIRSKPKAQVKVEGGKHRPEGFVEWVDAPGCEATFENLGKREGLLFPHWAEKKANELIQQCAVDKSWEEDLSWVVHCTRRGKATDLRKEGRTIVEIMERGRWRQRTVAEHYADGD